MATNMIVVPHQFSQGDCADAEKFNDNFSFLAQAICDALADPENTTTIVQNADDLSVLVSQLEVKCEDLESTVTSLESTVADLMTKCEDLVTKCEDLEERVNDLENP